MDLSFIFFRRSYKNYKRYKRYKKMRTVREIEMKLITKRQYIVMYINPMYRKSTNISTFPTYLIK